MRATSVEVLVEGLDHPEGVCWDPDSGVLWAGGEDGQLYRVDPDERTVERRARARASCSASRSTHTAGSPSRLRTAALRLRRRSCPPRRDRARLPELPGLRAGRDGLARDSGSLGGKRRPRPPRSPDGKVDVFATALPHFPNGCAVTADGRWLWLVESFEPTVNRLDLESGAVEEVARLEGTVPDGVAFTADGGVLVSCYRPDQIVHIDRDGAVEVVAEDPQGTLLSAPTNVCFMGAKLDRLVSANLGRWHLTAIDAGLTGAPLHYPERWAADA